MKRIHFSTSYSFENIAFCGVRKQKTTGNPDMVDCLLCWQKIDNIINRQIEGKVSNSNLIYQPPQSVRFLSHAFCLLPFDELHYLWESYENTVTEYYNVPHYRNIQSYIRYIMKEEYGYGVKIARQKIEDIVNIICEANGVISPQFALNHKIDRQTLAQHIFTAMCLSKNM